MIGAIAGGAPVWVYALLAALILLGVRRLRTRETPMVVAAIPVVAFVAWSLFGGAGLASIAGIGVALPTWTGGALIGAVSAFALPEPRATRLPGGRVRQPGSWMPLATYLAVFVARFVCGAWAAIVPAQAVTATAIGVAVGAAAAVRLAAGLARWRSAG